jgi:hypothetical protein
MKYSETSLNRAMTKPEFCINRSLNKVPMSEIFVFNLYNRTPVYSEHTTWPPWQILYIQSESYFFSHDTIRICVWFEGPVFLYMVEYH